MEQTDFLTWFMNLSGPYIAKVLETIFELFNFKFIPALIVGAYFILNRTPVKHWANTKEKKEYVVMLYGLLLGSLFVLVYIKLNGFNKEFVSNYALSLGVSYVSGVLAYDFIIKHAIQYFKNKFGGTK